MWDPFSWSFPLGRVFGIAVRVHLLFPVVALGLIMRAGSAKEALPHTWMDASLLMGLLFLSVLLHEFGHCAGARYVEGDAHQVLLWPLGGLASIDVPHTPRANFIATAAGPAVNLILCVFAVVLFGYFTEWQVRPAWNINPMKDYAWYPFRVTTEGQIALTAWDGSFHPEGRMAVKLLAWMFWVNLYLFAFNMVLVGFPMDAGRIFQCILWPRMGFRASMQMAVYAGFVTAIVLFLIAMVVNEWLMAFLSLFIYVTCRQQWIILETGAEDSLFGYDFTQGYTSLERGQDQPGPRRKRPNFIQRWLQKRAARRLQREQESREAEERRMDDLLEKVQREGIHSLTEEERRFMKRVSDRYRNRQ